MLNVYCNSKDNHRIYIAAMSIKEAQMCLDLGKICNTVKYNYDDDWKQIDKLYYQNDVNTIIMEI